MGTLDAKSKQLLEKDPGNPNAANAANPTHAANAGASFTSSVGPSAAPNPRAAPAAGRLSLKETIAAQKKASTCREEAAGKTKLCNVYFLPRAPSRAACESNHNRSQSTSSSPPSSCSDRTCSPNKAYTDIFQFHERPWIDVSADAST